MKKDPAKAEQFKKAMIESVFKIKPEQGMTVLNSVLLLKICRNAVKFMRFADKNQVDQLIEEILARV